MRVTVNIITDSQTSWGEAVTCDDYDVNVYDHFTHIQLLKTIDGTKYVIREVNVSNRHSFRIDVVED